MRLGKRHSPIFGPAPQVQEKRATPSVLLAVVALLATLILVIILRPPSWATPYKALDLLAETEVATPGMAELAAQNFPGSAYFYVEGAFDPAPEVQGDTTHPRNPHILTLKKTAAPASLHFKGKTALDSYRALNCLTSAIYYEAANEPEEGQRAVAQVVLNRVRHANWPNSICGVVYQGSERTDLLCQFSFACDGSMTRHAVTAQWSRARRVAQASLQGEAFAPVGHATYYHTLSVRPGWSSKLDAVAVVGAHIFYQMPGADSNATAFSARYNGLELVSGPALRPSPHMATTPPQSVLPPSTHYASEAIPAPAPPPTAGPDQGSDSLPQSQVLPEYQDSGRPLI